MCSSLFRSQIWSWAANHRHRLSQGAHNQCFQKSCFLLLCSRFSRWTLTFGWVCLALPQTFRRYIEAEAFPERQTINQLPTSLSQVKQKIEFRMNMYELKESRQMKPKTFANMVCCSWHLKLYYRHFWLISVSSVLRYPSLLIRSPTCCTRGALVPSSWSPL